MRENDPDEADDNDLNNGVRYQESGSLYVKFCMFFPGKKKKNNPTQDIALILVFTMEYWTFYLGIANFVIFCLFNYWVPQIIHAAVSGAQRPLKVYVLEN